MPTTERCRDIVRQLWPYLDDALPFDKMEVVVRHLEGCDECRSHFDFERAFLVAIRSVTASDEAFEPLRARVVAALAAEGMRT